MLLRFGSGGRIWIYAVFVVSLGGTASRSLVLVVPASQNMYTCKRALSALPMQTMGRATVRRSPLQKISHNVKAKGRKSTVQVAKTGLSVRASFHTKSPLWWSGTTACDDDPPPPMARGVVVGVSLVVAIVAVSPPPPPTVVERTSNESFEDMRRLWWW